MSLTNKVALITGAASGIGQATAIHFASLGCKLSLVDLNPNMEETLKGCYENELTEDRVLIQTGDVSDSIRQEEFVTKTVERFGQLDILINCAGIAGLEQNLDNTTEEGFENVFGINFKSGLRLIQLCMPYLKKTKGSVVNVSSMVSSIVYPPNLPYMVSKGAVDQLTRYAAWQLGPFGVRVNSVNPGAVRTNIGHTSNVSNQERISRWEETGKVANAMEIARPIAFLVSDNATFINDFGIELKEEPRTNQKTPINLWINKIPETRAVANYANRNKSCS